MEEEGKEVLEEAPLEIPWQKGPVVPPSLRLEDRETLNWATFGPRARSVAQQI